jgi:transglutaminase-like putative cysteine protease
MIDISRYRGAAQFGREYQFMLANDAHAPGSADRVLVDGMVRLCPETADYLYAEFTPTDLRYEVGSRPQMGYCLRQAGADRGHEEERVERICGFCAQLGQRGTDDLDRIRFGGTEEQIVQRGSDFCGELARVACVLAQIAGLPARMVMLADTQKAYWGHAIIEAFRAGAWGAADSTTNVVYRHRDGRPATTWELMNDPDLIESHQRGDQTPYTEPGTFRAAAIANYFAWEWRSYDYIVSAINDYYRSILQMSARGWPGGIRWLHGEDEL